MPISKSQVINGMKLSSSDKKALAVLIDGLIDDLETIRGKQAALTAKLDLDAGVTDTNYAATASVSSLSVRK